MTIGDKIKYFRKQLGITQNQLAEASGIHPVSIRKYETNKMQPQPPQIEKIAAALGISPNALNGLENSVLRLKTLGDLYGIIILFIKSNIIRIDGERKKDNTLKPDTVKIHLNPILSSYLKINIESDTVKYNSLPLEKLSFAVKDKQMFSDLLQWESLNYQYKLYLEKYGNSQEYPIKDAIAQLTANIERIELELQRSSILLDMSKGLKINLLPDYTNL